MPPGQHVDITIKNPKILDGLILAIVIYETK
jgi:hypothetical protein